jgi:predicted Mrr-cat superfamily restriction endonuclease
MVEHDDSESEDERARIERVRRMPVWQRAQEVNRLVMEERELILADLRERYPQADAQELRKRFAARVLPREIVIRMFGWDPEKEGY